MTPLVYRPGTRAVLRAVVNYGCVLLKPGHIQMAFHHRPHYIQELDRNCRDAAIGIGNALTACGLDTLHTEQIRNMVWSKAVNNSCMNPVCAVTGKTMSEVFNDPILFNLVDNLLKEGIAVARANEMSLGPDFYPDCMDYIRTAGHHKPSMLQDIEAGRRTEVDFINGKIIEYGHRAGMAAPFNTALRSLVKGLEPKSAKATRTATTLCQRFSQEQINQSPKEVKPQCSHAKPAAWTPPPNRKGENGMKNRLFARFILACLASLLTCGTTLAAEGSWAVRA